MFDKKYLRNSPDVPYLQDIDKAQALLAKYIEPRHEPLWYIRVMGADSPAAVERWNGYQTVENVEIMEQLGMHLPPRAHFFKGYGLERERPFIEKTIRYARELHKRNMLISVYVGGTLFTEYFFREVPEAREWMRVDMNGLPITYNRHLNRWFPCLNNPGFREYTKKVLDVAVEEIEADEIFFDNQILRAEPRSCRCGHCIQHFRELVRNKYTLEECERRYGIPEYPDGEPPIWSQANRPWKLDRIADASHQDWVDHRVATVVDFYRDMAEHVKARKPDTAVGMNIKGIHGHNRAYNHGVSHGAVKDIFDFSCIDGYAPGRAGENIASEVRFFKASHSNHMSVVDRARTDISFVEAAVMGYHKFIPGHGWLGSCSSAAITLPTNFLRGHMDLVIDRRPVRDIAVLRSEPSTNYNSAKVHEQLMPFEQTLAVEKLPWGIIFDGNIDELDEFRIIALPETQALSDAWVEALDGFLRAGGGVIASGAAGTFDAWYRSREPGHAFEAWGGGVPDGTYQAADVGTGRLVCVPEWEVVTPWDFSDWFALMRNQVHPVRDRELFRRAVAAAAGGRPLSHVATGNDFVMIEAIAAREGPAAGMDLHFINYDPDNREPVLTVTVGIPAGESAAEVTITDVEAAGYPQRDGGPVVRDGTAVFEMPTPEVYALAQVRFS